MTMHLAWRKGPNRITALLRNRTREGDRRKPTTPVPRPVSGEDHSQVRSPALSELDLSALDRSRRLVGRITRHHGSRRSGITFAFGGCTIDAMASQSPRPPNESGLEERVRKGGVPCARVGCLRIAIGTVVVTVSGIGYSVPLCAEHSRERAADVADEATRMGRPEPA